MRLMFWRRREIAEAEGALKKSREDRQRVKNLVDEVEARRRENKFAPLLAQAFREGR